MFADCVGYVSGTSLVLIGYPLDHPLDEAGLAAAVDAALGTPGLGLIRVIGPARPPQAPADAESLRPDGYTAVSVPPPALGPKLRNTLGRARRELHLSCGREYDRTHAAIVRSYLDDRTLAPGTRLIFERLGAYLEASPDSRIVSAQLADGRLAAFGVGEYAPLTTAFFMFCFRDRAIAPPGSTDLVLSGLLEEAARRGQTRMNLGLGVSPGIRFFKAKWGAEAFLPHVETSWRVDTATRRRAAPGASGPGTRFWESLRERVLGPRRWLDCIQVEVTSRCPGRCGYCPHTTAQRTWLARDMDMSTFERLRPLMRRVGRVHLQGWGEPLLVRHFFEMAAVARRAGCNVSTTTCGLRMDPDLALRIVESGIDIVAFSLAGTDAQVNDRARQGVDFERVCEAVATLQTVRRRRTGVHLEIHVAYLMLASAMDSVRGLPALMQRLGVHAAVVSTLDYVPKPELEGEAFQPHEADKLAAAREVLELTAAEARRLGLGFHYELPRASSPGTGCRENIGRSLFVSADGLLSPCIYVNVPFDAPDPARRVFGSIRSEDPIAVWHKPEFRRFRDRLAFGDPDLPCRTCPKRFMT
jgi:MoaA/NifB/PqqE/SkfB family radical SAM enzyme